MTAPVLELERVSLAFATGAGPAHALRDVSLMLEPGKVLGVMGESGSGKSSLAAAVLGLLPPNTARLDGAIRFEGATTDAAARRRLLGRRIAAIPQDPTTALNPVWRLGTQLVAFQRAQYPREPTTLLTARAEAMLGEVGLPDPARLLRAYPHELSGGMRQRTMVAAALLLAPALVLADEPTASLDPTLGVQVLELLRRLMNEQRAAMLLIAHEMGLIAALADQVLVLYGGRVMERGPTDSVLRSPAHPYTRALLACAIPLDAPPGTLPAAIPGEPPSAVTPPPGCPFAPRCPVVLPACLEGPPALRPVGGAREAACIRV